MIDKAIEEAYAIGYKHAQEDYLAGLQPRSTKGQVYTYRNGYSDGWHDATGAKNEY